MFNAYLWSILPSIIGIVLFLLLSSVELPDVELRLVFCGRISRLGALVVCSELVPSAVVSWFIADTPGFEESENRFQFVGIRKFLKDLSKKSLKWC